MTDSVLSGVLPTQLGLLSAQLTGILLANNPQLDGTVPSQLGLLSKMSRFWTGRANLMGTALPAV